VKISENDYLWKRPPEDFCQGNIFTHFNHSSKFVFLFFQATSNQANYTNRFVGVQYAVDMSIIKYSTNLAQNLTSNVGIFSLVFLITVILKYKLDLS